MTTRIVLVAIAGGLAVGAVLLLATSLEVWSRMPPPSDPVSDVLTGRTMGGEWTVRLAEPVNAFEGEIAVQELLDRLEGQISTWEPGTDLSRFNRHRGTDWFPVPPELATVVAEAQEVSRKTGGAFDVTVGPLVELWGFGPTPPADRDRRVPSDDAIADVLQRVGHQKLEVRLSPPALRKLHPELEVDLSGIGHGNAADAAAHLLDERGVGDYLVNVCGEMRAKGRTGEGRPWRVGIETPTPDVFRVLKRVELGDNGIATSGDYRIYFEQGGRRYSHTIDPRTGRPAETDVASVSVIDPSATRADALGTALMVMGADAGYAWATEHGVAALFITRGEGRFDVRATPAFEAHLLADAATAPATSPASAPETSPSASPAPATRGTP